MKKFAHHSLKRQIGISSGNSASKSLLSQGSTAPLSSIDKFVRETLQNSCDAQNGISTQVRMMYRYMNLGSEQSLRVSELLGFRSDILPKIVNAVPGLDQDTEIDSVLFVEDYGTTGLEEQTPSGDVLDSKFGRFFFGVGDNDESSDSGGSFGYGKAVYTDKSRIRTIVAYSCYIDLEGNAQKLLFGVTRTKTFEYESIKYPGFIFLCDSNVEAASEMSPIRGEEADLIAEQLGFVIRTHDQTGTSVAIFSPRDSADTDLIEIKASVENYWWKKIIDGDLTVCISLDDMDEVYADPNSAPHLKSFIDCYDIATDRRIPEEPNEKKKTFNVSSASDLSPGIFAFKLVEVNANDEWSNDSLFINSVALMRASGMVTEYWKPKSSGSFLSPVVGVFIANRELNKLLRSSEPASHWGWDSKSDRIEEQQEYLKLSKPITLDEARKEIESIIRRINNHLKEFAESCEPIKKISNNDFRKIGKLLTEIFGKGIKKTSTTSSRPFSIQYPPNHVVQLGNPLSPYYEETVHVALQANVQDEDKLLIVQHWLDVLGDDNGRHKVNELPSELVSTTAQYNDIDGVGYFRITKEYSKFVFRTQQAPSRFNRETRTEVIEK